MHDPGEATGTGWRLGLLALGALLTVGAAGAVHVEVHVIEPGGEPLPARMAVVDAAGQTWPSGIDTTVLSHGGLGGYFYTTGVFEMDVPRGSTEICAGHGFEWDAVREKHDLECDTIVTVMLDPIFDLRALGWYPGDDHLHTHHPPADYPITPARIHQIARAEDLAQIWCLDGAWEFSGGPHAVSTPEACVYYTTEYRHDSCGHVGLLGLREMIGTGCCWYPLPIAPTLTDLFLAWGPVEDQAFCLLHPHTGAGFFEDETWPGTGVGRELPVLAARERLDAMEIAVYTNSPDVHLTDWYHLLNCGLRVAPSGGSDACVGHYPARPIGGYRVYVYEGLGVEHDPGEWVRGLRAGHCFVTNYPLIPTFTVDGEMAGSVLECAGPSPQVSVHFRVACTLPLTAAHLIYNGMLLGNYPLSATPAGTDVDTTVEVTIPASGWLALRVYGSAGGGQHPVADALFAHSGPVHVHVDSLEVGLTASAAYFLDWLDSLEVFADGRGWDSPDQQAHVHAQLDSAREVYSQLFRIAPESFALTAPNNGAVLPEGDGVLLNWEEAFDPEVGDRVTYWVSIDGDSTFSDPRTVSVIGVTEAFLETPLVSGDHYWWRVSAEDRGGHVTPAFPPVHDFTVAVQAAALGEEGAGAGQETSTSATLRLAVWPNPSTGAIRFADPGEGRIWDRLEVLDAQGRCVRCARGLGWGAAGGASRAAGRGAEILRWDGCDDRGRPVPSGTYWVRLHADSPDPAHGGRAVASAAVLMLR